MNGRANLTPEIRSEIKKAARAELWRRGDLRYLLDRNQLADYNAIWSRPTEDYVLDVSRQTGKSWLLLVIANEFAIKNPGARMPYASLTQKSITEIIQPAMDLMTQDCPDDIKPRYKSQECAWEWPNGSRMPAAGTDAKHYTALRGPKAHIIFKDEVGFFEDSGEVDAVLSPQRMTTNGIIIEASTPPVSPGHPWTKRCLAAKALGRYTHRSIWEHGRLTQAQIEAFLRREADLRGFSSYEVFLGSSTYKREYLAMHVIDERRAVVREWQTAAETCTKSSVRPRWFLPTVGFDIGWRDGMAGVFGYWDFDKAVAVIEREMLLFNVTTPKVAQELRAIEREWLPLSMPAPYVDAKKTPFGSWEPFARWMDNNLLTLNDLAVHDDLSFSPTRKDYKELQVNELNRLVNQGRLLIHPDCVQLISQMGSTIWNRTRSTFERNQDGHGDLVDALLYFLRNLARNQDPAPYAWQANRDKDHINPQEPTEEETNLAALFG